MAFKTPGVYVQEISVFPPSVAEVETAIPAFVGYTEKAEQRGQDLTNTPTKISSLLDYHQLFGGGVPIASITVNVNEANNYAVTSVSIPNNRYLYESLRLFFDNGGGECYIVSVGSYTDTVQNGNESQTPPTPGLRVGVAALEKYDEPTMIVFPDAVLLSDPAAFSSLQQMALAQCAKLQDRVGVFDLREVGPTLDGAVNAFRNGIGINNLKYGAAYTPWLFAAYAKTVAWSVFRNNVVDSGSAAVSLATLTSNSSTNALVSRANTAVADAQVIANTITTSRGVSPTLQDRYKALKDAITAATTDPARQAAFQGVLGFMRALVAGAAGVSTWSTDITGTNLLTDLEAYATGTLANAVEALVALEKNADVRTQSGLAAAADVNPFYAALDSTSWLSGNVDTLVASATDYDTSGTVTGTIQAILVDLDDIFDGNVQSNIVAFVESMIEAADTHQGLTQATLYAGHPIIGNMVEHIKRELSRVPPSGGVVGRYAFVDDARGVWKAPANVGLNSVRGPVTAIDDSDQEDLNVDVTGGKSINAIRSFTGRGPAIIWGARTLAGNDNEWRYIPVRRFFNMVEESVKKSTAFAVFEPNSAPLWTKVKGMIDNYLVQKWRDGALAGATPEEAFYVRVGLGQTMTPQDILEGRMNVEIGMAVVRPAEFIILKFSHKLQES